MRPHGSPEELERRRQRALALLDEGLQPVEVAQRLGVDRRSVRRWKAAARQGGLPALAARPASGRPPKLPMRLRPRLEKLLLRGAEAAGYAQDLWTCPRIAQLIGREFNVHYHVAHVGRLLRRLGWTPQRPRRRARETAFKALYEGDVARHDPLQALERLAEEEALPPEVTGYSRELVEGVLKEGSRKAREEAQKTLDLVKEAMGFYHLVSPL